MDLAVIGTKYMKKLGLAEDLDESERDQCLQFQCEGGYRR